MKKPLAGATVLAILTGVSAIPATAQEIQGPITPQPGVPIQQAPEQARIKSRVTLVTTPVTVRDPGGKLIESLDADNFQVIENGQVQKILNFEVGGQSLSFVVVVETSSRLESLLPQLQRAGILISEQILGPGAEGAVIGFDDSIHVLQPFTRQRDSIDVAFKNLALGYSTVRLFDGMSRGIELLRERRLPADPTRPQGRRVMLVLSEALDTGSGTKLGDVLRQAQLANVTIYSVGLSTTRAELGKKPQDDIMSPPPPLPGPPGLPQQPGIASGPTDGVDLLGLARLVVEHARSAETRQALELGAVATGGAYFSTYKKNTLQRVLDEIGGELHAQYSLSYSPTDPDSVGFHTIEVRLVPATNRRLEVRARPGYYIAPE